MKKKTRMSAEERKMAIIDAAKPLFAHKGFNGVSVRDIALAAGVSEALLYRHFPSKDAMHKYILEYSVQLLNDSFEKFKNQEIGTKTLIQLIYTLFQVLLCETAADGDVRKTNQRLLFYSLLENTMFAKLIFGNIYSSFHDFITACYKKGIKDGDILNINGSFENRFWFIHHLAMSLNLCFITGETVFAHEGSKAEMIEDAVKFALRGLGVTEKAIRTYDSCLTF